MNDSISRCAFLGVLVLSGLCWSCDRNPFKPSDSVTLVATSLSLKADTDTARQGYAEFARNGAVFYRKEGGVRGGRGFNIAVLDAATGEVRQTMNYDTWLMASKLPVMNDFLGNLPDGTLVMLAIGDEAGISRDRACGFYSFAEPTVTLLEKLGSKQIRNLCYWGSWAMIAIKGEGAKSEQLGNDGKRAVAQYAIARQ